MLKNYIIFLDLPKDEERKIDLIRKKYNPNNYKKWKAHFTLKYEEKILINSEKKLFRILNEFFQHQKPVELKIGNLKINKQKNVGWNIYLEIKNPEIKEIAQDLSKKIETCIHRKFKPNLWEQSNEYYPHISIKGGKDLKDSTNFYNLIKLEKLNFSNPIICKTITLAYWDNNSWKKVRTFKLKNEI